MFPRLPSEYEQNSAQKYPIAGCGFVFGTRRSSVIGQAYPSSTGTCLRVQNRYPSPLRRSAHPGRPPFFRAGRLLNYGRQPAVNSHLFVTAIDLGRARAHISGQGARRGIETIGSGHRFCDRVNRGAKRCGNPYLSRAFLPQPQHLRPVTQTPSARLLVPAPGLPSLSQPEAIRLSAVSWAAQPVPSATTSASVSNIITTSRGRSEITNRASGHCLGGRFFSFAHPKPGPEGGHPCSRKS